MPKRECLKCGVGVLETEETSWNGGEMMPGVVPLPPVEDAPAQPKYPPRAHRAKELSDPSEGLLPIWAHMALYIGGSMVGFLGGAVIGATASATLLPHGPGFVHMVLFFGGAILGLHIPRLIMGRVFTACCPKGGGPAFIEGHRPISYRCRNCQYLHRTTVTEGN